MNKIIKSLICLSLSMLMIFSSNFVINNDINASHIRTSVYKKHSTRYSKRYVYNYGCKLANLLINKSKLNSSWQAKVLRKNLNKRLSFNNKYKESFCRGYIKQYKHDLRKSHVNSNEARNSLRGIRSFLSNYKNRLFYKGFVSANMKSHKRMLKGYSPSKHIQRYKHNHRFLEGLTSYNMVEGSSKDQAQTLSKDFFRTSIA